MREYDRLEQMGFSLNQINQIMLCKDYDLSKLSADLPLNVFTAFRKLVKTESISPSTLIEYVNASPIECVEQMVNILIQIANIESFDERQSTLNKFESLLHERPEYCNINKLYEFASANLFDTPRLLLCADVYEEKHVDLLDIITKDKDFDINKAESKYRYDLLASYESLLDCRVDFPIEAILSFDCKDKVEQIINFLNKNKDINVLLFKKSLEFDKILVFDFLEKNNKELDFYETLDINKKEIFLKFFEHDKETFLNLYGKNYSYEKLSLILDCVTNEINYSKILNYPGKLEDKIKFISYLTTGMVSEETFKYLVVNVGKYKPQDFKIFLKLFDYHSTSIRAKIDPEIFDTAYNSKQREILAEAITHGINMFKYCGPEFSAKQINVIYKLTKSNKYINLSKILDPKLSPEEMEMIGFYSALPITKKCEPETLDRTKYIQDTTDFYGDFMNVFDSIFTSHDEFVHKMPFLRIIVYYNETHAEKFDIERTINFITPYFDCYEPEKFQSFISLGQESIDFINANYLNTNIEEKIEDFLEKHNITNSINKYGNFRRLGLRSFGEIDYGYMTPYGEFDEF